MVVKRGEVLRSDTAARMASTGPGSARSVRCRACAPPARRRRRRSPDAPDAPLTAESVERGGGVYSASSGYFAAVGLPLLAGRDFTDEESFAGAPVGIERNRGTQDVWHADGLPRHDRIVAAAARTHGRRRGRRRAAVAAAWIDSAMYAPFETARFALSSLVVDADDTAESREALKRALSNFPDARVQIRSLDEARLVELTPFRFNALVVGAFAALTLALAIVGVYGVTSAVVGERTREYGIRLALGATRQRVNRHVLGRSALPLAIGIAAGLVLAGWGSRYRGESPLWRGAARRLVVRVGGRDRVPVRAGRRVRSGEPRGTRRSDCRAAGG